MNKTIRHPLEAFWEQIQRNPAGSFSGVHGAVGSLLLAYLARIQGVTLVVVPTLDRAKGLFEEVKTWLGKLSRKVSLFLPDRNSIYDQTSVDPGVNYARMTAMAQEFSGGGVVICPAAALCERISNPKLWRESAIKLVSGKSYSREELLKNLVGLGYIRANLAEEPGQFAVRGSLVDVFSPHMELPARLDFFGEDLETIKIFSPESQRTLEKIPEVLLVPALETFLSASEVTLLREKLEAELKTLDSTRQEILLRRMERLFSTPDGRDFREMAPYSKPGDGYLWDYWTNPRILIENPDQAEEIFSEFVRSQVSCYSKVSDLTPLHKPDNYYYTSEHLISALKNRNPSHISRFREPGHKSGTVFEVSPPASPMDPTRETLLKDLRKWLEDGWAIGIILSDSQRFHNLKGLLGERHFPVKSSPDPMMGLAYKNILMIQGDIRHGFLDHHNRIAVLCEDDLYLQTRVEAPGRKASSGHVWAISQLVPGDLVVHSDHGVAEYRGIQTMTAGGNKREYLLLQYAGSDKLFVPTDQVHKVQKYIGMEGVKPGIHSLNSKVWDTQKRRVKHNVEVIARELLELYARRQASPGFAFLPDEDLQLDMESRFPYVPTPDQAKAIKAMKEDMEAGTPMDRIICGDVGYGKTEVAIRSAFKAVCSGKQVAVLAPTTLLAFQHQQTFSSRLDGFPVKVSMVSRLVPAKKQKEIFVQAKRGEVDILIGTHRILSKEIQFKDLGLVIIDEEQRFGVKHKERFKELRSNLDLLTLTATPIPRTLHMALSGIRQISVIDTPPLDRRPVQTYVAPFDPAWAKRAIIEELKRGGQVYYVFNRVERIHQKAAAIRELVPEARIAVAHGQMEENLVEKTMLAFIKKDYDVLLSTTIIESGLDIPNVNTLIVDEAERLGLSQMYQLRGRVGRSSRQAWAYFFYSKGKRLTQEAHERLSTIEEHTALGSGFRIAMRDLQIRGAGNILGKEQSGHIAAVGFSLYIELLEEAVAKLKGEPIARAPDTVIEIPVSALIPSTYVPDDETRIELYSRLARCSDLNVLELFKIECEDRFGRLPDETRRLMQVARLRILGQNVGVNKITQQLQRLRFEFDPANPPDPASIVDIRVTFFKRLSMSPNDQNAVHLSIAGIEGDEIISFADTFLSQINLSKEKAVGAPLAAPRSGE